MSRLQNYLIIILGCGSLLGCTVSPTSQPSGTNAVEVSAPTATPNPVAAYQLFAPDSVVDYQLGGSYPPAPKVTVVTRDSTDQPAAGRYSICYVNGFQTQPGVDWPSHLVLKKDNGEPLIDENWPDEEILDISSDVNQDEIAALLDVSLESCASKGFKAVEFDNFDSYTRSGGQLTDRDAEKFAARLVSSAHQLGLAAGQKNAAELLQRGRNEVGFDFAVVEECDQFEECAAYTDVYGPLVIDIEYTDALRRPFAEFCADPERPAIASLRDRYLVGFGSADYEFENC